MTTMDERLQQDGVIDPVLFYGKHKNPQWACFSNFSGHGFWMEDPWTKAPAWYATGEHRYQAMKAQLPHHHEYVRTADDPGMAKDRGREIRLRDGWGNDYGDLCWYVMFEVILVKTFQHGDVWDTLAATGIRPIYEDSPVDDIWGWRYEQDYRGKNLLGRCWMQVRDVLQITPVVVADGS